MTAIAAVDYGSSLHLVDQDGGAHQRGGQVMILVGVAKEATSINNGTAMRVAARRKFVPNS